ncbi:hypothetical protein FRC03_002780 [Tulasnella sp. 419]|nr:hypothetical protein FRC03_002780 [Tulasnella sp. 419]
MESRRRRSIWWTVPMICSALTSVHLRIGNRNAFLSGAEDQVGWQLMNWRYITAIWIFLMPPGRLFHFHLNLQFCQPIVIDILFFYHLTDSQVPLRIWRACRDSTSRIFDDTTKATILGVFVEASIGSLGLDVVFQASGYY